MAVWRHYLHGTEFQSIEGIATCRWHKVKVAVYSVDNKAFETNMINEALIRRWNCHNALLTSDTVTWHNRVYPFKFTGHWIIWLLYFYVDDRFLSATSFHPTGLVEWDWFMWTGLLVLQCTLWEDIQRGSCSWGLATCKYLSDLQKKKEQKRTQPITGQYPLHVLLVNYLST